MTTGPLQHVNFDLDTLFQNMGDAVYLIDPHSSNIVWCNRAGHEELGYEKHEILNHSVLSLQTNVKGLPHWDEIKQVILNNPCFTFTGSHKRKGGGEIAVEVNTTHFEHLEQTYFLSVARNVTNRLTIEKDMHSRNQRIWFALNEATDGLWEWELESDHVFFSPQLKKMLGYGPDEMEPHVKTWINNVHPDDLDRVGQILKDHLQGRRGNYEAEYRLRNRNGHFIWVHDKGKICERDGQGKPTFVVGMVENITKRKQLQFQLENLAANDVLTQLPNRHQGEEHARQQIELAQSHHQPLCLAVIDFDNFKQINDLYGHQKGDEVLVFGAQLLKQTLREDDFVYRWGGEEFVALFPNTRLNDIETITYKIHQAFKDADWASIDTAPLTVSIGIACCPEIASDFDNLIKQADCAVYLAKEQGRNQTVVADLPAERHN